jgi:hypothetical protein
MNWIILIGLLTIWGIREVRLRRQIRELKHANAILEDVLQTKEKEVERLYHDHRRHVRRNIHH